MAQDSLFFRGFALLRAVVGNLGEGKRWKAAGIAALMLWPAAAHAWWNKDWAHRVKIEVPATTAAAQIVPVSLHIGNFSFEEAKPDGADVRFVNGDDMTPLNYHFELFDNAEQLAVIWVQLPAAADSGPRSFWMYYGNPKAVAATNPRASYDASDVAVFHFGEKDGSPRDVTSYANEPKLFTGRLGANGVADGGVHFAPSESLVLNGAPQLDINEQRGFSLSAWIKPDAVDKPGLIFSRAKDALALELGVADGHLYAQFTDGKTRVRERAADPIVAAKWQHIAMAWSDRLVVYMDGKPALTLARPARAVGGDLTIGAHSVLGAGFAGQLDELNLVNAARPAAWVAATATAEDPAAEAAAFVAEEQAAGGESEYFAVLRTIANAVSWDGWFIIALIGVLGFISGEVMISKFVQLLRIENANREFLTRFRALGADPTAMVPSASGTKDEQQQLHNSGLYQLYRGGVEEFRRQRDSVTAEGGHALAPANFEVIKANIDTTIVNESNRMNRGMVLLTLAVSAAPFLGLLGTVVGIMVTFGSIALAGDVNVNTIAPGVAAAITTTVAGLAVAIPVMFVYNYLATKIRELATAMDVFANEFVGRLASQRISR
jgi:biopolymer transport protein ExbB